MKDKYNLGVVSDNSGTYSSQETQVGTWLDKPLYRRVYKCTTPSNFNSEKMIIDISDIDYDYIDITKYIIKSTDNKVAINSMNNFADAHIRFWIRAQANDNPNQVMMIMQYSNENANGAKNILSAEIYITIEYTKNSD